IKVLGRVVSSREADLSFRNSGRIREVFVQPGDMVEAGKVLAELDQRDLPWNLSKARISVQQAEVRLAAGQAKDVMDDSAVGRLSIRSAELGLGQAELNLEKLRAGPDEAALRQAEAEVADKQAALDKARFDVSDKEAALVALQAQLEAKQRGPDPLELIAARAEVELAKLEVEEARAGTPQADLRAAQIALDQERTKLARLHDLPKVRAEEIANARADVELAQAKLTKVLADIDAGDIKGETARSLAVREAQIALDKAQNAYNAKVAQATPKPEEIRAQEQAVTVRELELNKLQNRPALDLQAAQATLAAKQATLDRLLAGPAESELAALQGQIQAQQAAIENAKQAVGVAEANLAAAQAKLQQVTSGPTVFQVQEAQNQVVQARSQIESAQAQARINQENLAQRRAVAAYDLEQLRRAIDQARLDVRNLEAQTGDVKIVAPFAGRITRLAGRPGDNVQAFFPVLNLSSLEGLVVKADIAEADLQRIAPGMPVELTMDAYPNQTLSGRIDALPQQTVGQVGQAPDRATRIVVDWPGPGAEMGMLARVQITLQIKPDVLIVPNGAVRTVGRRRFVEYMDGEIKRSRNVEIGIVTDQETEITSGVQEGMVILAGQS
ncbi:MAG TPA: efflux RND transporter periplasmic adaptor subunit, partial [Chloroflexota bacterium]|nr:efflux RND transporter periplasmic adaptor subunit [Chloroflexota bacterium]